MQEHIIIVAYDVYGDTRAEAMDTLMAVLPKHEDHPSIDSWWIAEDDRRDRSDNDAAIFIPNTITQAEARIAVARFMKEAAQSDIYNAESEIADAEQRIEEAEEIERRARKALEEGGNDY